MANARVNRHEQLSVMLLQVRRHIATCRKCRAAIHGRSYDDVCIFTKQSLLIVAERWDQNIPGRLAAANGRDTYTYPCPDPSAHGKAYAVTAEPVIVTTVIDRLL